MDGAGSDREPEPFGPTALQKALLARFQRELPLVPRPYAAMAEALGAREAEVIAALEGLREAGVLDRVGATIAPNRVGASTLAAMAVPSERLEEVAAIVSGFPEVNHNYEREHRFNLWFVVVAHSRARVERVLALVEARTGLPVLDLPLERAFKVDLGFPLPWS
ncbi:MAG: Lrp/AsnC family transcriptional regulator [Geminicoccaceae bacterium]|nr:Lrp/AsnC family transcriptional regulator [Geminicoccaceae bacterium]MDW8341437.1 Lrp/AsnC family transcriptional regulator [Geminicoccaceae bacterium]